MFIDVEQVVIEFLTPKIAPVRVYTKVPAKRPPSFVRVWRTGGAAANQVLDFPQLTLQGWAQDTVTASSLTRTCQDLLFTGYTAMPLVRGVTEVGGVYYDPDPVSESDRYTFTIQLTVRSPRV